MNPKNVKSVIIQKCDDEFNSLMNIYKNKYHECRDNIDLYINERIMKMVGEDLYDYQNKHNFCAFYPIDELCDKKQFSYPNYIRPGHPKYEYMTKYMSLKAFEDAFMIGERYIIYNMCYKSHYNVALYITNYGRMLLCQFNTGIQMSMRNHDELNFWIPIDYIYIIQNMINQYRDCTGALINGQHQTDGMHAKMYETIKKILTHLRDNLLNGKYVKNNLDIKFMDVYERNERLNKENEDIEKQREEIALQYRRLNQERKDLRKQKDKLALVAVKIKMEKEHLVKDQNELKKQLLSKTDFDDLLEDIDI